MTVEIKPHQWVENGERHWDRYFPFIDGVPRHDITCRDCKYYSDRPLDPYGIFKCHFWAKHAAELQVADTYGPVCRFFEMQGGE